MKHGKLMTGKLVTGTLIAVLLTGFLSGCGGEEPDDGTPTESETGRYVEAEETLPGQWEDWTIKQLFAVEDRLHVLAAKQEGDMTVLREWEQQGEEFIDVTQDWLSEVELPCEVWLDARLLQTEEDVQYLFANYVANGEEVYQSHLWRGEGGVAKDITPEKWMIPDEEWGGYENVLEVAALSNNTLAAVSYTSMDILYGEDGSVLESETISGLYGEEMVSDGENVYLCALNHSGNIVAIEKRKNGRSDEVTEIPFPESSGGSITLCALKDGTLIAAGADGIFRCRPAGTDWEKLLDGSETDFSLAGSWCVGMAAMEDGRLYALFQDENGGVRLTKYEYDPDAVTEVTQTLKLYTVYESSLLQQAAAMYHREHPEVLITIQHKFSDMERYTLKEPDYNAVYQELNTMLMGEDAPDILVMDHLNMDSYAEKGLLTNIDDVIRPLEDEGVLMENITGAYVREDGNRYAVPLQFGFCLAIGRDIAPENMESIEALAEFLSGRPESYLGSQTVSELVDKFYPYFCGSIVSDKQLDKEALGKNLEYLKLIADNCGMVDARSQEERCYNMWDLASGAKLAFDSGEGFRDCMAPLEIKDYIEGEFVAFENCFIPSLQMGICTKSKYVDTARDFLNFVLSESIQDTDYYSGFPVNRASLEKQVNDDRSDVVAATSIETSDGGEEMFSILDFSKEDADRLLALCESLDRPVKEDAKIREILIETLGDYLSGVQSRDETIRKIEGGLKMYLAE